MEAKLNSDIFSLKGTEIVNDENKSEVYTSLCAKALAKYTQIRYYTPLSDNIPEEEKLKHPLYKGIADIMGYIAQMTFIYCTFERNIDLLKTYNSDIFDAFCDLYKDDICQSLYKDIQDMKNKSYYVLDSVKDMLDILYEHKV
jgi:hypothetical protein